MCFNGIIKTPDQDIMKLHCKWYVHRFGKVQEAETVWRAWNITTNLRRFCPFQPSLEQVEQLQFTHTTSVHAAQENPQPKRVSGCRTGDSAQVQPAQPDLTDAKTKTIVQQYLIMFHIVVVLTAFPHTSEDLMNLPNKKTAGGTADMGSIWSIKKKLWPEKSVLWPTFGSWLSLWEWLRMTAVGLPRDKTQQSALYDALSEENKMTCSLGCPSAGQNMTKTPLVCLKRIKVPSGVDLAWTWPVFAPAYHQF